MNADTFSIVYTFLKPTELNRLRYVSRWYNSMVNTIWLVSLGTNQIEQWVCPLCGNWRSTDSLANYDGFFDRTDRESERLVQYVRNQVFRNHDHTIRVPMLCSDCEYREWEYNEIHLPFAGSRQFHWFLSPFVSLLYRFADDDERIVEWNEFRLILNSF